MRAYSITPAQARSLILRCQMLEGKKIGRGTSATLKLIEQLGYLQIDTISVVARAHHHILWSRQADFQPEYLHQLQANDRSVFEYWAHAAAFLPMKHLRFYRYKMNYFLDTKGKWCQNKMDMCGHLLPKILKRIEKEGGLSSRDFQMADKSKSTGWWDWKPAKVALELLFWQGKLMVSERRGFQKVYDLPERVIPTNINMTPPEPEEVGIFQITQALQALGVAREKDMAYILQLVSKKELVSAIQRMLADKQLMTIRIKGSNQLYYILPVMLEQAIGRAGRNTRCHILSPFDNLIIQRDRCRELFGFNYTIECYLPSHQRKYGYFSLPILWKGNFAGRVDLKAHRKKQRLLIQNIHFEKGFQTVDRLVQPLSKKLIAFAQFNGCTKLEFNCRKPRAAIEAIQAELNHCKLSSRRGVTAFPGT
jgi:uncharacterized protein